MKMICQKGSKGMQKAIMMLGAILVGRHRRCRRKRFLVSSGIGALIIFRRSTAENAGILAMH